MKILFILFILSTSSIFAIEPEWELVIPNDENTQSYSTDIMLLSNGNIASFNRGHGEKAGYHFLGLSILDKNGNLISNNNFKYEKPVFTAKMIEINQQIKLFGFWANVWVFTDYGIFYMQSLDADLYGNQIDEHIDSSEQVSTLFAPGVLFHKGDYLINAFQKYIDGTNYTVYKRFSLDGQLQETLLIETGDSVWVGFYRYYLLTPNAEYIWGAYNPSGKNQRYPFILKIADNKLQWIKHHESEVITDYSNAVYYQNKIYISGVRYKPADGNKCFIRVMDDDFNIVDEKYFLEDDLQDMIQQLAVYNDKLYVFSRNQTDSIKSIEMMILDEDLEEIYKTEIKRDTENIGIYSTIKDGNYIYIGGIYKQNAFITKISDYYISVDEQHSSENLAIFPNPAKNVLNIKLPVTLTPTELSIYNILGEKVLTAKTQSPEAKLNISSLPAGVYTVRATINGTEYSEKFVKE